MQRIALEKAALILMKAEACFSPQMKDVSFFVSSVPAAKFLHDWNAVLNEVDGFRETTDLFDVVGAYNFEDCIDLFLSWLMTSNIFQEQQN